MDSRPLEGKRIVLTRDPEQAREMQLMLEARGAKVMLLPAVEFFPAEDTRELDRAIYDLKKIDWIIFTSQNAVKFFSRRARELDVDLGRSQTHPVRIAAVGPATARVASEEGLRPDFVSAGHTGQSLADELGERLRGAGVLLPQSDRSDGDLARRLGELGARVTPVVAYRTGAPRLFDQGILEKVRRGEADVMVFASPSAFHNLEPLVNPPGLAELSKRMRFAAIGPTTAMAMRYAGVKVSIEATDSSAEGLADSIAKVFDSQIPAARIS
jgi:uroporphyrinogen-III synthase